MIWLQLQKGQILFSFPIRYHIYISFLKEFRHEQGIKYKPWYQNTQVHEIFIKNF